MNRLFAVTALIFASASPAFAKPLIAETVLHQTRVKILESNNISTRPGSVYDNITYFESLLTFPRPQFNYEFVDTGLGAAEPIYPLYQKGFQDNWGQLLKAFLSHKNRHIDHYTFLDTPQGCRVDGIYLLRHITEYPKTMFVEERKQGFEMVVIRLEHYTRKFPTAECGRHISHDPDPKFNPIEFVKKNHTKMLLSQFQPQKELARFEARMSVVKHVSEKRGPKRPKFDLANMSKNHLWYYPQGHAWDYGVSEKVIHPGSLNLQQASDLVLEGISHRDEFPLERQMTSGEWNQLIAFMDGQPEAGFDTKTEPGNDALKFADVKPNYIYTSGLERQLIKDVRGDVTNMKNFALVGVVMKPYDRQEDATWEGERVIPQLRLVYQMMDPKDSSKHLEQLYFHLKYDAVDRDANENTRRDQHAYFLARLDQLAALRRESSPNFPAETVKFVREFTSQRPVESIAFSSALTGIWTFGTLSRAFNAERALQAVRIVRQGIDVGYYSTVYDNDIFRKIAWDKKDPRQKLAAAVVNAITPTVYRDSRRQNTQALQFNKVTCTQCHQTSGRDGVHFALNDHLDSRVKSLTYPSEFLFRESLDQLKAAAGYWGH